MEKAYEVLKETFGFDDFRLSQKEVVQRLLVDNENALVLFPTGGGKSLTYQLPALCLDGLTLVISPLIALMKDQVDALVKHGVKAASLDSTQGMEKSSWIKDEVLNGNMKILFVAPERLNNEGFINMMKKVKVSLLAVDESHCISQWGASFRPEYLKIARFAEELDVERVLCLTATATQSVADDICRSFYIDSVAGVFRTPVYRPNLAFLVKVAGSLNQKISEIVPMLKTRTGPAIVYVSLQKQAEEVANTLKAHGLDAEVYHAGLSASTREQVQSNFMQSEKGIVCATIAFGMGIDKANIRQVIHLFMPKTLENYSQEVGRAGRDGLASECVMFLSPADIPTLEGFCRGDTCAERDLKLWLQEVAFKAPSSDGTVDFNLYQQAKQYDIRSNVLNLLYAHLELDHSYLRATTPYYSIYEIISQSTDGFDNVRKDLSPPAKAIRACWQVKASGYTLDVNLAADHGNVDRSDISRKINDWEFNGWINTKPSQVRNRYIVLKRLPKETAELEDLAGLMYNGMVEREREAIEKLGRVIELATADDCIAHSLACYFGDSNVVPDSMCGKCTFCTTGAGVTFVANTVTTVDRAQVKAILDACTERDDPRLLARFAFGITSPRLTALKCSTHHPLFGSMVHVDFPTLVQVFDKECKKAGYQNIVLTAPAPATKKRTYAQSSSSTYYAKSSTSSTSYRGRGGNRGGYGGGGKRARKY